MKPHPANPRSLAEYLECSEGTASEFLDDMRSDPSLYYVDHVALARHKAALPLSDFAWRQACLTA